MSSALASPFAGVADMFLWLGGGSRRDVDEHTERAAYQTAGLFVVLNAVVAGSVVWFVAGQSGVHGPGGVAFGLASGALIGALGRMLAIAPVQLGVTRGRLVVGELARALVAALIGVALGEMAALAVFAGSLDRELLVQRDVAGVAVSQGEPAGGLTGLLADRAALDAEVTAAAGRRDQALVVARCEYRPGPGCPAIRITGDPGRGPATAQADAALATAQHDLDAVGARRDQLAPALDRAIVVARARLTGDAVRARELAGADTGLDARWAAMNGQVGRTPGAWVLRAGLDVLFAMLMLLPLLLRWWRGQTEQDRRVLARGLRNRAERDADTAVALHRARQRVTVELDGAPLPRELIAPGSSFAEEIGQLGGPVRAAEARSAEHPDTADVRPVVGVEHDRLPVPVRAGQVERRPERTLAPAAAHSPLDLLPGPLPGAVRTLTGLVRPLVPGPVARLAATAPRSVRLARGLWEEVEELQFTLRQRRTVRIVDEEYEQASEVGEAADDESDAGPPPRPYVDAQVVPGPVPRRRPGALGGRRTSQLDTPATPSVRDGAARRELPSGSAE